MTTISQAVMLSRDDGQYGSPGGRLRTRPGEETDMRFPQVGERMRAAPAHAMRAMFAGLGQVLLVADRMRSWLAGLMPIRPAPVRARLRSPRPPSRLPRLVPLLLRRRSRPPAPRQTTKPPAGDPSTRRGMSGFFRSRTRPARPRRRCQRGPASLPSPPQPSAAGTPSRLRPSPLRPSPLRPSPLLPSPLRPSPLRPNRTPAQPYRRSRSRNGPVPPSRVPLSRSWPSRAPPSRSWPSRVPLSLAPPTRPRPRL